MIFAGHGMVWDTETGKPLCQFENGRFETEDVACIERLQALGYKEYLPSAECAADRIKQLEERLKMVENERDALKAERAKGKKNEHDTRAGAGVSGSATDSTSKGKGQASE